MTLIYRSPTVTIALPHLFILLKSPRKIEEPVGTSPKSEERPPKLKNVKTEYKKSIRGCIEKIGRSVDSDQAQWPSEKSRNIRKRPNLSCEEPPS